MSVLREVLKEEAQRLKKLSKSYKDEIKKLPRGSISVKKIRNGRYAYRAYRNGDTVKFEYLGKSSSEHVRQLREKIVERRKLESLISQATKNLREVEGMLRGRQS